MNGIKKILRGLCKLDKRYQYSLIAIITELFFVFVFALIVNQTFYWGMFFGIGAGLISYIAYLYRITKGFTKFAKLNDERLLALSDRAQLISHKVVFVLINATLGFSLGFLYALNDTFNVHDKNVTLILWTVAITCLSIAVLYIVMTQVVYIVLKKRN